MTYQEPYKISNINLSNIVFNKSQSSTNKKIIFIKYNDENIKKDNSFIQTKQNFVFQLPTLNNQYNINNNEFEISLTNNNNLIDFFNNLDNIIINCGKTNADTWFNHVSDKSKINYQRIIRDNNNNIKIKIINNDDFQTQLYLNDNKKINIEEIPNNALCTMVLECYAVWINSNIFGLLIRPIIINFKLNEIFQYNYKLIEESDEELLDSDISTSLFVKNNDTDKIKIISEISDELEENEEEYENEEENYENNKEENDDKIEFNINSLTNFSDTSNSE
jgi:hypothetical protein